MESSIGGGFVANHEAFSVATLMYTKLRRVIGRVIDVTYLIENTEYANHVLNLAFQSGDFELAQYAQRLKDILNLDVESQENKILASEDTTESTKSVSEATEEEIYKAEVPHHYIGSLR